MTVRHQGGGHKRRYRIIDFKRIKDNIPAKVATIEYDPNRSANIALLPPVLQSVRSLYPVLNRISKSAMHCRWDVFLSVRLYTTWN